MKPFLILLPVAFCIAACFKPAHYYGSYGDLPKVMGYKPIYSNDISQLKISLDTPHTMRNAGKIYLKGNNIYQADKNEGIHIYDKSVPENLKPIGFLNIHGISELSISGNYLFANTNMDLLVIDISDIYHPKPVKMVANAFGAGYDYTYSNPLVPLPEHQVYYECIDSEKGILVGWKKDSVQQQCYYH